MRYAALVLLTLLLAGCLDGPPKTPPPCGCTQAPSDPPPPRGNAMHVELK